LFVGRDREIFFARRNFDDPDYVRELFLLVHRFIGELRRGGDARVAEVVTFQRVYDQVVDGFGFRKDDLLDVPEAFFPERGFIPVSYRLLVLLPLDSLKHKATFLIYTLNALAAHMTTQELNLGARQVSSLVRQIKRTTGPVESLYEVG
jgi:hypothetical protein